MLNVVIQSVFLPIVIIQRLFLPSMMEQVAWNKSSLLLKNISQNTQTLQLYTIDIETESIYKSY